MSGKAQNNGFAPTALTFHSPALLPMPSLVACPIGGHPPHFCVSCAPWVLDEPPSISDAINHSIVDCTYLLLNHHFSARLDITNLLLSCDTKKFDGLDDAIRVKDKSRDLPALKMVSEKVW